MVIRGEDPRNTVIMLDESLDYPNVIVGNSVENVTITDITIRLRGDKASTGIFLYEDIYGISKNIRIENIYFYGGKPNETGEIGVYLRNAENVVVAKSYFIGVENAVKCTSCNRVSMSNNVFREVSGGLLIVNRNAHDVSFTGNEVETTCNNTTTCSYIYVNESDTLRFTGNKFRSNPLNYVNHEEWFNIGNSANIDIEANHFQLASYNALSTVVVNVSETSDVFIANNRVEGGPIVYTGDGCSGVTVTNNMVSSSDLYVPGSNTSAILSPSDDDKNYLYDYQGTVFLEDKPLTATCVIETDGNGNYWALTPHGKIIESTSAKEVYDKCREIIVTEGGGKIFFRKGTYTFSDTIFLADKMVLQGEGRDDTILKLDSGSGSINVIAGVDVQGVVVSDLRIELRSNTRTTGILIHGFTVDSSYVRIHDITITARSNIPPGSKGIYLNNVWRAQIRDVEIAGRILTPVYCQDCSRVIIEDSFLHGSLQSPNAIIVGGSSFITIRNNDIYGYIAEADMLNSTLYIYNSSYIEVSGNRFSNIYNGILYAGASVDVHFDGNEVYAYCNSPSNTCPNMIVFYYSNHSSVSNNILKGYTSLTATKSFTWVKALVSNFIYISSNDIFTSGNSIMIILRSRYITINSNNMYATNINSSYAAVYLGSVDDVKVLNNYIRAPGTYAFYLTCTRNNIVISNNVIIADNFLQSATTCLLSPTDNNLNYLRSTP